MIRRYVCPCGWGRDYRSTLVLDHEARVEIQAHVIACPENHT